MGTTMALEGIKVVDMTRLAPGPYCTMFLADMGADVIKVEPGGGRAAMALLPQSARDEERRRAFNPEGRNKRSITLNLKIPQARDVFYRLARDADVLVEEFRPGVAARLGVDYETISAMNPSVVYCSLTGYGQNGPYREMAGHDINYLSIGGFQGITGEPGGRPVVPTNIIADYSAGGMQAAIGILTALVARQRTGRGQHVDVAMLDGVVSLMHTEASHYFSSGEVPGLGSLLGFLQGMPFYGLYQTKDGKYISLGAIEPWFYENLCKTLGREDLVQFQWADREKHKEIQAEFQEIFLTRTRDEWFELFKQTDTCAAPVLGVDEVFQDPQVLHRKMMVELDHPTLGKVRQVGISIKLSDTPGAVRSFAPTPGQHSDEILAALGYSSDEIAGLKSSGAVA